LFLACTSNQEQSLPATDLSRKAKTLNDSIISIALFDLSGYKAKAGDFAYIQSVIRQSMDKDHAEMFLSWASVENFHFLDFDRDGDLDIVYSSLLEEYRYTDINSLRIFQRITPEEFKLNSIPGYVYETNMFEVESDTIIIKTVRRPCCMNREFVFFITEFNRSERTFKTTRIGAIDKAKVAEKL